MALPDVLSAMRSIILDPLQIPAEREERHSYYRSQFPKLSEIELEDLAKIEPKGFGVYTHSIFTAERGIIHNHFPITYAVLERSWERAYAEELDGYRMVRRMHELKPWRSATTHSLASIFVAHLREDLPELQRVAPELNEIAQLELMTLEVKRHPNDENVETRKFVSMEETSRATVEALMEMQLSIPGCARFVEQERNVVETYREYHRSREYQKPEESRTMAAGSRNRFNVPKWIGIGAGAFDLLKSKERMQPFAVTELAESVIADLDPESSEEAMFLAFLQALMGLVETGVVLMERA